MFEVDLPWVTPQDQLILHHPVSNGIHASYYLKGRILIFFNCINLPCFHSCVHTSSGDVSTTHRSTYNLILTPATWFQMAFTMETEPIITTHVHVQPLILALTLLHCTHSLSLSFTYTESTQKETLFNAVQKYSLSQINSPSSSSSAIPYVPQAWEDGVARATSGTSPTLSLSLYLSVDEDEDEEDDDDDEDVQKRSSLSDAHGVYTYLYLTSIFPRSLRGVNECDTLTCPQHCALLNL